jgi:ribonuclease HI
MAAQHMAKKKFYVVWEGYRPGIFVDWKSCEKSVKGYDGAKFKGFETREAAEAAFADHYSWHIGHGSPTKTAPRVPRPGDPGPLQHALSVDAACSGNPGVLEYRGVWVADGREHFRMGPYPEGTVNIGEFLAIVHGLALLKQEGSNAPIYSDSMTALKWVRDKRTNTKLPESPLNTKLFDYMRRAEAWLRNNTYTNPILKWDTAGWGEIPADYGRK